MIRSIRKLLSGKKSYITAAAIFIIGGLQAFNIHIPNDILVMLSGILGISLRAGIAKK